MAFCTNCGQRNDDAARVCTNCGKPLSPRGGAMPYTPPAAAGAGEQQTGSPWATPSYGDAAYAMQAGRAGLYAVGEKREPIMVLILTLVTCGIYGFYVIYQMSSEIRDALGRQDVNPGLDLALSIVTCGLYLIYLAYRYPQLILEMQDRVGLPRSDISVVSLLLAIFGLSLVSLFMIQTELNKVWDAAGRR